MCQCLCVFYNGGKREQRVSCNLSLGLLSGKNATLLIHEATLEDGMEEEACEKRHRYMNTGQ